MGYENCVIIDNIVYNATECEIIAVNGDGTYDIKAVKSILGTHWKFPHVKVIGVRKLFKIGDIVWGGFEIDNKTLPIIIGLTSEQIF